MNPAPARPRRTAAENRLRTRAIVGGTSVAAFLAVLAGVAVHDHRQPASNVSADTGASNSVDPSLVQPGVSNGFGGQASSQDPFGSSSSDPFGSSGSAAGSTNPFSGRFSGGGFSATPGTPGASSQTRSHGS